MVSIFSLSLSLCIARGASWHLLTCLVCTQFHHHQMSWIRWIIMFKSWQHDESIWIACWMMTEHHLPLSPPGRPWDATNSSEPTTKSACIGAWQKSGRIRCKDGLAMLGLASGQFGPVIIFQPRSVFVGTWNWRLRCLSGCWSRFLAWLCLGFNVFRGHWPWPLCSVSCRLCCRVGKQLCSDGGQVQGKLQYLHHFVVFCKSWQYPFAHSVWPES